jgi:cysteinyl-tRNA synthetase
MHALGVLPPHTTTRVTQHIPEVVSFVERLVAQGFAYVPAAGDGVYFDTAAFEKRGHSASKLVPRRRRGARPAATAVGGAGDGGDVGDVGDGDLEAHGDSGGSCPSSHASLDALVEEAARSAQRGGDAAEAFKRDPRDFALWKFAKDGEALSWPSPWGVGRPGWHIECSAMVRAVFGGSLDVHGGGIDLRYGTPRWALCAVVQCTVLGGGVVNCSPVRFAAPCLGP